MKRNYVLSFITIFLLSFISVAYAAFNSELTITGEGLVQKDTIAPTCGSWYLRESNQTIQEAYNQNPDFINPGTNTTWTNTNKKLFIECTDNMQGDYGCINGTVITTANNQKRYFVEVKEYTTSIQTDSSQVSVTLKDAYQNERTCTLPVGSSNPYIDKQEPTVTITQSAANKFTYSATDDLGVTGYMVTTTSTAPTLNDSNWVTTPSEVTIDNTAAKTYYVWAKDGVNISSKSISTFLLTKTQGTGTTLTLRFKNSSGATLSTGYVLNGTEVYALAAPKTGYNTVLLKKGSTTLATGSGTNSVNSTQTISAATTLSSSATVNTYTVTFDPNGGSGTMASQVLTYNQNTALSTNTYTRAGYTFAGWNTKADGTGTNYTDGQTKPNVTSTNGGTATLYAQWTANSYTVTADANGGTIPTTAGWTGSGNTSTKSVTFDSAYGTLPSTPSKAGYTFAGWSLLPEGYTQVEYIQSTGTQYINTGITPTANTGINIDYSYNAINSSTNAGIIGVYQPTNPRTDTLFITTKSGKTNSAISLISKGNSITAITPTANTKYNAKINWFNNNLLDFNDGQYQGTDGSNGIVSKNLILFGRYYNDAAVYTSARIYRAQFSEESAIIHDFVPCIQDSTGKAGMYDIVSDTFFGNNGTGDFTSGNAEYISTTTIVKNPNDHNIYAKYTANSYTVTANANGGTIPSTSGWTGSGATSTKNVTYNNTYGTLPSPTKTGQTFAGWSLLPEGYTPVEYIESSGAQRIDTGINPTGLALGIDLTFKLNEVLNDRWLLGEINWVSPNSYGAYDIGVYSNKFLYTISDSNATTLLRSSYIDADTDIHNLKFNISGQAGSFDGEPLQYATITSGEYDNVIDSANYSLFVFARNGNVTSNNYMGAKARIYGLKIYSSSQLVRNYIPCINDATGKAGLYDLVSGTFFDNSGSGDFTYGSTTYLTSDSIVTATNDHTIYAHYTKNTYTVTANANGGTIPSTTGWTGSGNTSTKSVTFDSAYGTLPSTPSKAGYTFAGWSLLPEGYTQVEYIEASGTQYINTGIKTKQTLVIESEYATDTASKLFFGARSSSSANGIVFGYFGTTSSYVGFGGSSANYSTTINPMDNSKHKVLLSNNYYKLDGVNQTISNRTTLTSFNDIYLGTWNTNGSADSRMYIGKIYRFTIYDGNDLVLDLIPCINNSTGKAGMYDIVSDTFFGNNGTGDFTSGNVEYILATTIVKNPGNHDIYAKWSINDPATPTITRTGDATKIYGASATTLTCASSTSYATGTNKYYSFGYATTDGGTSSNWTTPDTTNIYVVPANEYVGQRWYSCKVYASDGTVTSSQVSSLTSADAELTINNAKLTFNANTGTGGGTVYSKTGANVVYNGIRSTSTTSIPTATKTGYSLTGWYTATSGGTKVLNADGSFTGTAVTNYTGTNSWAMTADRTLYAQWEVNEYTITYDYNNTYWVSAGSGVFGDTDYYIDWDKDFTITGLWKYPTASKQYLVIGNYDDGATTLNIELTTANKFRILLGNGTVDAVSSTTCGRNVNVTYTFTWSASTNTYTFTATGSSTNVSMTGTANMSGQATKTLKVGTKDNRTDTSPFVTTTYYQALSITKQYTYGGTLTNPNSATKPRYTFNGWFDAATGGNEVTDSTSVPAANTTYYAQWTPYTYQIKYNANGGSGTMANTQYNYDESKKLTANAFTRTGYTFVGWTTSSDGTGSPYYDTQSVSNMTNSNNATVNLYARWRKNTYEVVFNGNESTSGSMSNETLTYGTAGALTANSYSKTGYTYSKWNTNALGTGTDYANQASMNVNPNIFINTSAPALPTNTTSYGMSGRWAKTSSSITPTLIDVTDAPSNLITKGFNIPANTTTGKYYLYFNNILVESGQTYTISVYAKGSGSLLIHAGALTPAREESFELTDQWQRYEMKIITLDATTTGTYNVRAQYLRLRSVGFGTASGNGAIQIAGAKMEVGETATEYIDSNNQLKLNAQWTPNTYTIAYTMNNGSNPNPKPTSGTTDSVVSIGTTTNTTKTVTITGNVNGTGATVGSAEATTLTFQGWSSNTTAGLGSNAKTGTSSSAVSTAWNGSSSTNKYFKNLRDTSGTVTLTANWSTTAKLPTVTKQGYVCSWYSASGTTGGTLIGGSGENWTAVPQDSATSITVYARCTEANDTPYIVNHYVHNIGANTYTLDSTDVSVGTTNATLTLTNLKKTIAGFTYVDGYTTGSTTKPTSGAVTTTTILADGTRVINLYYRRNYLYVQYNVNGGGLAETHGAAYDLDGSLITNTSNTIPTDYLRGVYGGKVGTLDTNTYAASSGLHNVNNTSGINVSRTGYSPKSGAQWNSSADGTGTSYNHDTTTYDADGFAGADLSTGDKVVTIYVNWVPNTYTIAYTMNNGSNPNPKPTSGTYDSVVSIGTTTNTTKTVTITGNANGTGATVGSATVNTMTFSGWSSSSGAGLASTALTGSSSSSVSSGWSGTTTTNKYFKNLRSTSGTVTLTANWTGTVTLPTLTEPSGYTCKYYDAATGGNELGAGGATISISQDSATAITAYVQCTGKPYTVTYYLGNNSSTPGSTQIGNATQCTYGTACSLTSFADLGGVFPYSSASSSDQYWTFYGWANSNSSTSKLYNDSASINPTSYSSNINLYAIGRHPINFYGGIKPSSRFTVLYQYWNPHSTDSAYLSSITLPSSIDIDSWTFTGYLLGDSASVNGSVTFASSLVGTEVKPAINNRAYYRSIYQRTLTVNYNGNTNTGGSTTATTKTQYYNSGISTDKISTNSITLASNGFTKTGYSFVKWADGSTSGTQYSASTAYTGLGTSVSDTNVSTTMYAIWDANVYEVTLDNQSATTSGTTKYYYKYNTSTTIDGHPTYYYEDSALTTPINDGTYYNSGNGVYITLPTKSGYTFGGYYTETNGGGTKYVTNAGLTTNSMYKTTGNKTLYAQWTYSATPTITRSDYNTFTVSATAGSKYIISKTITTKPAADNAAWSTTTSQDVSTSAKETWYVWVKDANGNVSANYATITNFKVTLTAGTGTTLTAKADNASSGSSVATNTYVLANTPVYPIGALTAGYNSLVVKKGSSTITNGSSQTITADTTFTTSSTADIYSVSLNNQGATTAGTANYYYRYKTTTTINGHNTIFFEDSDLTIPIHDGEYNSSNNNGVFITKPEKTGYTFGGYFTATGGSGTQYVSSEGGTMNSLYLKRPSEINSSYTTEITLYAKWTEKTATLTYNANGHGTAPANVTMKYTTATNAASALTES